VDVRIGLRNLGDRHASRAFAKDEFDRNPGSPRFFLMSASGSECWQYWDRLSASLTSHNRVEERDMIMSPFFHQLKMLTTGDVLPEPPFRKHAG